MKSSAHRGARSAPAAGRRLVCGVPAASGHHARCALPVQAVCVRAVHAELGCSLAQPSGTRAERACPHCQRDRNGCTSIAEASPRSPPRQVQHIPKPLTLADMLQCRVPRHCRAAQYCSQPPRCACWQIRRRCSLLRTSAWPIFTCAPWSRIPPLLVQLLGPSSRPLAGCSRALPGHPHAIVAFAEAAGSPGVCPRAQPLRTRVSWLLGAPCQRAASSQASLQVACRGQRQCVWACSTATTDSQHAGGGKSAVEHMGWHSCRAHRAAQ